MTHIHTHSVGRLWTRDRYVTVATPRTTRNIHKRRMSMCGRDSNPQSQQASGGRSMPFGHLPSGSATCSPYDAQQTSLQHYYSKRSSFLPPLTHKHANMFLKRNALLHFLSSYAHLAVYLHVQITKKKEQHIEEEYTD